jgi:aromatic ring-opening dioxygenase LigB subunit
VIVFGAIAPHGDPAFEVGSATNDALGELGRRLELARPDVTVLVTPHNVHVEGLFAVVMAASMAGALDERRIELSCVVDRALARAIVASLRAAGLPAVGISYGSNDLALAEMPMDWGTLIPLWFLGGRAELAPPVAVVSPVRELSLGDHVRAGEAIAAACEGRRAAVIASADHGHAHDHEGPFGFDPASAEYDSRVVELVSRNRLGDALDLEPIVDAAKADSLWQMVMLHGALGDGFAAELLSYEAPTYFGMLCAAFEPRGDSYHATDERRGSS